MMRDKTGIVCVLAALAAAACSWGNGSGSSNPGVDASGGNGAVCGDNVCAATEVNNCPQDCGNGGNNNAAVCGNGQCETTKGESATSCPSDCSGGGGGSGSGSGGGSGGALNCSDPTVLLACFTCISGGGCTGVDMNSCQACLGGGLGSGLGSGTCNNDGVCDPGETSAMCPLDNCP